MEVRTKSDELKQQIIDTLTRMVDDFEFTNEDEITDGKNEGIKTQINETRELIERFKNDIPEIYIYVEGGNIQGISANQDVAVNIFDKDNLYGVSEEEEQSFYETFGTPEEWDEKIKSLTESKDIKGVY
jgi:hypothetical protein